MARTAYSTSLAHRSFERILLVKPSSLGDVVHALPVLHALRTRYPRAKVDWLIASPFAELLESHFELDELILFDRRRFARIGRSPRVSRAFLGFLRDLRARRYDLVIDLQGLFRTGFIAWATGAPARIGFRNAREGAWMFYTHRIRIHPQAEMHAVDRNYRIAKLLGFADVPVEFNLALTDSVRAEARDLLRERGLAAQERLVAVVPGARWETKVWLPERFVETIDELDSRNQVRCVLLGGSDEVSLCERIATACRRAPINLAGRTSLRQLAAVLGLAELVVCHDSAAMHLAVALERPLVCLIGPTNPLRTGPYRRSEDVVRRKLDCAPCYLRRLQECPHDHRCMKELDVTTVVAAASVRLGQSAAIQCGTDFPVGRATCRVTCYCSCHSADGELGLFGDPVAVHASQQILDQWNHPAGKGGEDSRPVPSDKPVSKSSRSGQETRRSWVGVGAKVGSVDLTYHLRCYWSRCTSGPVPQADT